MVCWGQTLNVVIGFILVEAIYLLSFITLASLALHFSFTADNRMARLSLDKCYWWRKIMISTDNAVLTG